MSERVPPTDAARLTRRLRQFEAEAHATQQGRPARVAPPKAPQPQQVLLCGSPSQTNRVEL